MEPLSTSIKEMLVTSLFHGQLTQGVLRKIPKNRYTGIYWDILGCVCTYIHTYRQTDRHTWHDMTWHYITLHTYIHTWSRVPCSHPPWDGGGMIPLWMYVCMYAWMYVSMCVCIRIYRHIYILYVNMFVNMCVIRVYFLWIYVHMHVYICTCCIEIIILSLSWQ